MASTAREESAGGERARDSEEQHRDTEGCQGVVGGRGAPGPLVALVHAVGLAVDLPRRQSHHPAAHRDLSLSIIAPAMSAPSLSATYHAPASAGATFARELPAGAAAATTETKTAYFAALRSSVAELQGEVNVFLTRKMDEDNKAAGVDASKEAKLEETYGEEVVEEDDS